MPTILTRWLRPTPARRPRAALAGVEQLEARDVPDATRFALAFTPTGGLFQDWSVVPTDRLTAGGNWNTVPSIIGYSGAGLTGTAGDAGTVLNPGVDPADTPAGVVAVQVNQMTPNTLNAPLAEFDRGAFAGNPTVALRSVPTTGDSPFLLVHLDATGANPIVAGTGGIWVSFLLRDIQTNSSAAVPVAVQYRYFDPTGPANQPFITATLGTLPNVADGTTNGPDLRVMAQVPRLANPDRLQVRVITTTPAGTAPVPTEWVGIDYINVSASRPPTVDFGATSVTYTEGTTLRVVNTTGVVTDLDSADLNLGTLTVSVSTGFNAAEDRLGVFDEGTNPNQLRFAATGANTGDLFYRFGGAPEVLIGTSVYNPATGVLTVTFNANATPVAAQAVLRNVTFSNLVDIPDTTQRVLTAVVTDGDGAISLPVTLPLTVNRSNDAPTADPVDTAAVDYLLNTAPVFVAPNAVVTDPDFPGDQTLTGGVLTVSIPLPGASSNNRLAVLGDVGTGPGSIRVTPFGNIEYTPPTGAAAVVAQIERNGFGTTPLAIRFNNPDPFPGGGGFFNSPAVVQAIMRRIVFSTVGNEFSIAPRTLNFNLTDGDGTNDFQASPLPTTFYADFDTQRDINPLPANTAPSFTLPGEPAAAAPAVAEDVGAVAVDNFATAIAPGLAVGVPAYEAGQALTFTLTAADTTLFTAGGQPVIDPLTGRLTYTPAPNRFGTTVVTAVLRDDGAGTVKDAMGTPGDPMETTKTFTITINPVAETPTVTPAAPVTAEDTPSAPITVTPNPVDNGAGAVTHYRVTAIRGGILTRNTAVGPQVSDGEYVPILDALVFSPTPLNANGTAASGLFGFTVQASLSASPAGLGGSPVVVDVAVTPVNDKPVLADVGTGATLQYLADGVPLVLDPDADALVTDVDSADFAGGSLTVTVASGLGGTDVLDLRSLGSGPGQVEVSGTTVSVEGVPVGTIVAGPGDTLIVNLTANATPATVAALIRNVTFAAASVVGARTIAFTLDDGDGGNSPSDAATVTLNVTNEVRAQSLVRTTAQRTNATPGGTLKWQLTTDLRLTNLGPDNFDFDPASTLAGTHSVTSVVALSETLYEITVALGGTGDGTLGLRLADNDNLTVNIPNAPFAGEFYNVDRTGPAATAFTDDDTDDLLAVNQAVVYQVQFSADVNAATVGTADFDNAVAVGSGGAAITVNSVVHSGGGLFDVSVTPTTGGALRLRVPAGAVVADDLGNDDAGAFLDAETLTVDAVLPGVLSVANNTNSTPPNVALLNADITYTVRFTEPVQPGTVSTADFVNGFTGSNPATVTVVSVTPTDGTPAAAQTFAVVVRGTMPGSLRLQTGNNILDVAGNPMAAPALDGTTVTVNAAPVAVADTFPRPGQPAIFEDGGTITVPASQGVLSNDTDQNHTTAQLVVTTTPVTGPTKGTLVLRADGSFDYTPNFDANGADTFTYRVTDPLNGTSEGTATIVISAVNDAPTFDLTPAVPVGETLPTVTAAEDSGPFPATTIATNALAGGTGAFVESDALVGFSVSVVSADPTLSFSAAPQVQLQGATGRLTFTPAPNAHGRAVVEVTLTDAGGNSAPNVNNATKTFQIVVTAQNDAPTFFLSGNPPVSVEDAGPQTVAGFATFNPGPNESETPRPDRYTAVVTQTTGNLTFAVPPAVSPTGTLTYAAAADATGTATVRLTAVDAGGLAAPAAQTFLIVVRAQNDVPIANPDTATVGRDSSQTFIPVLANDTPDPDGSEFLSVVSTGPTSGGGVVVIAPGGAGLLYTPAPGFTGTDTFTYRIADGNGGPATSTVTVTVLNTPAGQPLFDVLAVGTGPGGGALVKVNSLTTGAFTSSFLAYDPKFRGGVSVGMGDVNGDGVLDVVVTPGTGGGPHVKVIDGTKLGLVGDDGQIAPEAVLASFFAYRPDFSGGVTLAVADVNRDGKADIITGTGPGGGAHVKVISGALLGLPTQPNGMINTGAEIASFLAYEREFRGGVNVAAGDVNGDGQADIVAAAGVGGSRVKVFNGLNPTATLLKSFFAYGASFTGGVNVAAGDVNGDGLADVITGAGVGGGPHVKVIDGATDRQLASFFGLTGQAEGADVAFRLASDATPLVVVAGQKGGSQVRTYAAPDFVQVRGFDAYEDTFLGGVEVS